MSELLSGKLLLINNYFIWLTSSAVGFGILFAVISQSISKGENESIASKALKLMIQKGKNEQNGRMDSQQWICGRWEYGAKVVYYDLQ